MFRQNNRITVLNCKITRHLWKKYIFCVSANNNCCNIDVIYNLQITSRIFNKKYALISPPYSQLLTYGSITQLSHSRYYLFMSSNYWGISLVKIKSNDDKYYILLLGYGLAYLYVENFSSIYYLCYHSYHTYTLRRNLYCKFFWLGH